MKTELYFTRIQSTTRTNRLTAATNPFSKKPLARAVTTAVAAWAMTFGGGALAADFNGGADLDLIFDQTASDFQIAVGLPGEQAKNLFVVSGDQGSYSFSGGKVTVNETFTNTGSTSFSNDITVKSWTKLQDSTLMLNNNRILRLGSGIYDDGSGETQSNSLVLSGSNTITGNGTMVTPEQFQIYFDLVGLKDGKPALTIGENISWSGTSSINFYIGNYYGSNIPVGTSVNSTLIDVLGNRKELPEMDDILGGRGKHVFIRLYSDGYKVQTTEVNPLERIDINWTGAKNNLWDETIANWDGVVGGANGIPVSTLLPGDWVFFKEQGAGAVAIPEAGISAPRMRVSSSVPYTFTGGDLTINDNLVLLGRVTFDTNVSVNTEQNSDNGTRLDGAVLTINADKTFAPKVAILTNGENEIKGSGKLDLTELKKLIFNLNELEEDGTALKISKDIVVDYVKFSTAISYNPEKYSVESGKARHYTLLDYTGNQNFFKVEGDFLGKRGDKLFMKQYNADQKFDLIVVNGNDSTSLVWDGWKEDHVWNASSVNWRGRLGGTKGFDVYTYYRGDDVTFNGEGTDEITIVADDGKTDVAVNNMLINANGYSFTGADLSANTLDIYSAAATFNNKVNVATKTWLTNGSTATVNGELTLAGELIITGAGNKIDGTGSLKADTLAGIYNLTGVQSGETMLTFERELNPEMNVFSTKVRGASLPTMVPEKDAYRVTLFEIHNPWISLTPEIEFMTKRGDQILYAFDTQERKRDFVAVNGTENTDLIWHGVAGKVWNTEDEAWKGKVGGVNGIAINTFLEGDTVIFNEEGQNNTDVNVAEEVVVNALRVESEDYSFTGNKITAQNINIAGGSAAFTNELNVNENVVVASGATLSFSDSQKTIEGTLNVEDGGKLSVVVGATSPLVIADAANFNTSGTLNIVGYSDTSVSANLYTGASSESTVIATSNGVTLNPAHITVDGSSTADFITANAYVSSDGKNVNVQTDLTWNNKNTAHGTFTVDNEFTLDYVLAQSQGLFDPVKWDGETLTKEGVGTLILAQDNTYTGKTIINAGTLQIGNGAAHGSVAGDIELSGTGTLVFDRATDLQYEKAISGAQGNTITKKNSNTLILTGDSSQFLGDFLVNEGSLQLSGQLGGKVAIAARQQLIADGAAAATGDLELADGAVLTLQKDAALTAKSLQLADSVIVNINGGNTISGDADFGTNAKLKFNLDLSAASQLKLVGAPTSIEGADIHLGFSGMLDEDNPLTLIDVANVNVSPFANLTGKLFINSDTAYVAQRLATPNVGQIYALYNNDPQKLQLIAVDAATSASMIWQGADGAKWSEASWIGTLKTPATPGAITVSQFRAGDDVLFIGETDSKTVKRVVVDGDVAVSSVLIDGAFDFSGNTINAAGVVDVTAAGILGLEIGTNPALAADSLTLENGGRLNLAGYRDLVKESRVGNEYLVVQTASGITGLTDSAVTIANQDEVDFMTAKAVSKDNNLYVQTALAWLANDATAHGNFTLADGASFNLDAVLADQGISDQWDGTMLTKQGAGLLILSADNTYTGTTQVQEGTLQLGNGGETGSVTGNIVIDAGARLIVNRSDAELAFDNTLSGTGSFVKEGAGVLTMIADNTGFNGISQINQGALTLTQGLGGTLRVNEGSTLNMMAGSHSQDLVLTNATLNAFETTSIAGDLVAEGATLNFFREGSDALSGTPFMTVAGNANLNDSQINIGLTGDTPKPDKDTKLVLLQTEGDLATYSGKTDGSRLQGMHGVTTVYEFVLSSEGNQLLATIAEDGTLHPQTKSFSEAILAGVSGVRQGADLAADQGVELAHQAARSADGLRAFGTIAAGDSRYKTGSHVDVKSVNGIVGLAFAPTEQMMLGAFFEYGNGSYDSHNSFATGKVKGDGDTDYIGGGIMGRINFDAKDSSGLYGEFTAHLGRVSTDYNSSDLVGFAGSGQKMKFESKASYYGASLGFGYLWQLSQNSNVDVYAKYLFTHQGSDSAKLSSGEVIDFDSVNSQRLRGGLRLSRRFTPMVGAYVGAAYEHEFDGEASAQVSGNQIAAPDLSGGTGIFELGMSLQLGESKNLSLNLGVQGYVGQREGVSGSVQVKYSF